MRWWVPEPSPPCTVSHAHGIAVFDHMCGDGRQLVVVQPVDQAACSGERR
jgi:hypothetical protein